jgi:hypothetical protein
MDGVSVAIIDLLHRTAVNEHGARYRIADVRYDVLYDRTVFELLAVDPHTGEPDPERRTRVFDLSDFTVY